MLTIEERATAALQQSYQILVKEHPQSPICPLCDGNGAVTFDVSIDHPAFGRAFKCPCQDVWGSGNPERGQKKLEAMFGKDGIPKKLAHFTFEHFKGFSPDEYKQKRSAILACKALAKDGLVFIESTDTTKYGVVLSGMPGLGKSALSVATSRAIASKGNGLLWKDWNDLVSDIQDTYNPKHAGTSKAKLIDACASVRVLVLDDVGSMKEADHMSPDERKILYSIIRPRHASSLVTILTTNLDRPRLKAEVDPRTYRRVRDLCVWIDMGGSDLTPYGQEL